MIRFSSSLVKRGILKAGIVAARQFSSGRMLSDWVLCAAPVPEGNRGDQALMHVAVDRLLSIGVSRLHLLQTSQHPIESISDSRVIIHSEFAGLFTSERSFAEQVQFIRFIRDKRCLLLLGADVLDGHHGEGRSRGSFLALSIAGQLGVPSRVLGFSVNDRPHGDLRQRMLLAAKKTTLCARDQVTFDRLEAAGVPNLVNAGDLAYLLKPGEISDITSEDLKTFISSNKKKLIGLNFTRKVVSDDKAVERLFEILRKACTALASDGWRFVLIPHDDRGGESFSIEIFNYLKPILGDNICHLFPMPTANSIKGVVSELTHLFTCRLHLGIAGLSQAVAVSGFPYQGKFEGQFEQFGLADNLLAIETFLWNDVESTIQWMRNQIDSSDATASSIRKCLPSVLEKAERNFSGLERFLVGADS